MNLKSLKMVCVVLFSAFELLYSIIRFAFLKRDMITVFGGHKTGADEPDGRAAYEVSYQMVKAGYGIFAGGGSGIMKAAHHGACAAKQELGIRETLNVGIVVKHLKEGRADQYADYFLSVRTFFVRKWLLMRFSMEFIIFPGGFGTLDEFMELITLLKTGSMNQRKIILFGKKYWGEFFDWFTQHAIETGLSDRDVLSLFEIVDSVDDAVAALKKCCADVKR